MKTWATLLIMTMLSFSAVAYENFTGKVTLISASAVPDLVKFRMDTGNATCPAGTWLKWSHASKENNKVIYSTLMTALVSEKNITFFIADGDKKCSGKFLHLLNN